MIEVWSKPRHDHPCMHEWMHERNAIKPLSNRNLITIKLWSIRHFVFIRVQFIFITLSMTQARRSTIQVCSSWGRAMMHFIEWSQSPCGRAESSRQIGSASMFRHGRWILRKDAWIGSTTFQWSTKWLRVRPCKISEESTAKSFKGGLKGVETSRLGVFSE